MEPRGRGVGSSMGLVSSLIQNTWPSRPGRSRVEGSVQTAKGPRCLRRCRYRGPSLMCVRRCPTLPHSLGCSTIGAVGLSFRVRDGTGRFPHAMTAVTLLTTPLTKHFGGCGKPYMGRGDTRQTFTINLSNPPHTLRCWWAPAAHPHPQERAVGGVVGFVVWGPPSGREHA